MILTQLVGSCSDQRQFDAPLLQSMSVSVDVDRDCAGRRLHVPIGKCCSVMQPHLVASLILHYSFLSGARPAWLSKYVESLSGTLFVSRVVPLSN